MLHAYLFACDAVLLTVGTLVQVAQLEEQNSYLLEQIAHLQDELKAASFQAECVKCGTSAQIIIGLQQKFELHKASTEEIELSLRQDAHELSLEIRALKLALEQGQGSEDAEILRLRTSAQNDKVSEWSTR